MQNIKLRDNPDIIINTSSGILERDFLMKLNVIWITSLCLFTKITSSVRVNQDCFKCPWGPWEPMGTPYCASHLDAYPLVGRIQTRCFQPNIAMSPAKRRATICSVTMHCFPKPWISPIVPPSPFHHSFCSSKLMAKAGKWQTNKQTNIPNLRLWARRKTQGHSI